MNDNKQIVPKKVIDVDENITLLIYNDEYEAAYIYPKLGLGLESTKRIVCASGYCNAIEITFKI